MKESKTGKSDNGGYLFNGPSSFFEYFGCTRAEHWQRLDDLTSLAGLRIPDAEIVGFEAPAFRNKFPGMFVEGGTREDTKDQG